jgi:hypothetical protein
MSTFEDGEQSLDELVAKARLDDKLQEFIKEGEEILEKKEEERAKEEEERAEQLKKEAEERKKKEEERANQLKFRLVPLRKKRIGLSGFINTVNDEQISLWVFSDDEYGHDFHDFNDKNLKQKKFDARVKGCVNYVQGRYLVMSEIFKWLRPNRIRFIEFDSGKEFGLDKRGMTNPVINEVLGRYIVRAYDEQFFDFVTGELLVKRTGENISDVINEVNGKALIKHGSAPVFTDLFSHAEVKRFNMPMNSRIQQIFGRNVIQSAGGHCIYDFDTDEMLLQSEKALFPWINKVYDSYFIRDLNEREQFYEIMQNED